jgi:hypothetical protein
MATQDYAASIQGVGIRVTRLDAFGNLLNGPGDSYATSAFIRTSFTPEYEEGDEITEKSANGTVCVSYKSPDTLKRITIELAICNPDPELTALASGGILLRKETGGVTRSAGWASPGVGDDPSGYGVALEVWSRAIRDGKPTNEDPFFHWLFPYVKMRLSGDRAIENGLLATTFEGFGLGNVSFGSGPDGRWLYPSATDRPYLYSRADWSPQGLNGLYTWHGEMTAPVSNIAVAAGTATLTTSTAHGFQPGDRVTLAGVTVVTAVNGTHTIVATPTATTFTVTKASLPTTTSTAATGTATVAAGPRTVNTLDAGDEGFNVPGNVNYNPSLPIDSVITASNVVTP